MSTETERLTLRTLAANIKKPSRAAAFESVQHLADELAGTEHRDALALLYRYLMPAVPKRAKTTLEWLAQAIDPRDDREILRVINVIERGGKLVAVASDGHRIHIAHKHGFETTGAYNTAGEKIDDASPRIERFLKAYLDCDSAPLQSIKTSDVERAATFDNRVTARLPDGPLIDAKYLDQALAGTAEFGAYCSGFIGSVRLDGLPFGEAVIAPFRD